MHHTLSCHHQKWLHIVDHALCGSPMMYPTTVFVSTVESSARFTELARDLRVDEQTFIAVAALWEEFTVVLWVNVLALGLSLVTLWPMFAPNHEFVVLTGSDSLRLATTFLIKLISFTTV